MRYDRKMNTAEWEETAWFQYLDQSQQKLVTLSGELLEREKKDSSDFFEYSFIIFPLSKAFEGFLKQYFYDLALIDTPTFEGRRFRVGRALNPDIRRSQRDEFWLYDDVEHLCGEETARELWETWLECRNRVFHFFPSGEKAITLARAEQLLHKLAAAMAAAVACYDSTGTVKRIRSSLHSHTQSLQSGI